MSNKHFQHYPYLDLLQFGASILVIFIHCGRLVAAEPVHFILKSLLCRLAVPLHLISSGYFYATKSQQDPAYSQDYFRRQIKVYLVWSLIYLPYGFHFLSRQKIAPELFPVGLFLAIVYLGTCYHLWYFPALFFGLKLMGFWRKKWGLTSSLAIAFLLYLLGACETYSAVLPLSIQPIYQVYRSIFQTTRNGLFYTPIFIVLGFLLAEYQQEPFFSQKSRLKLVAAVGLLLLEGWMVYQHQGDDKNFLFGLLPVTLCLVNLALQSNKSGAHDWRLFKQLSKWLFFLHPAFLEFFNWSLAGPATKSASGLFLGLLTLISTLLASYLLIKLPPVIKKTFNKLIGESVFSTIRKDF